MAMVKGGAVAALPGLPGRVDGNFTDTRSVSQYQADPLSLVGRTPDTLLSLVDKHIKTLNIMAPI